MKRTLLVATCAAALSGCGAAPSSVDQPEAAPVAQAPAASAPEPASAGPSPAPAAAPERTEEAMRAAKSLDRGETPFPEIEAVTKDLGAPAVSGKAKRRQWRYGTEARGTSVSCETIDLVGLPSGAVAFDTSVLTSPECKKVKTTEAQVSAVVVALGADDATDVPLEVRVEGLSGASFDEAAALFEKKLGPPAESGEPELAGWRYQGEDGACRLVIVTSRLGSGAGEALWGAPCK